jgi:hypothetical protein
MMDILNIERLGSAIFCTFSRRASGALRHIVGSLILMAACIAEPTVVIAQLERFEALADSHLSILSE